MDINDLNDRFSNMTIHSVSLSPGPDDGVVFYGRKDGRRIEIYTVPRDCGLFIDSVLWPDSGSK